MCSLLHFKVAVMGCHLDPAVTYCYAGNVELVLAVFVGLKGHTFIKGVARRGHDSNSAWYLFRIPLVHRINDVTSGPAAYFSPAGRKLKFDSNSFLSSVNNF